jgi:hypothetical protein
MHKSINSTLTSKDIQNTDTLLDNNTTNLLIKRILKVAVVVKQMLKLNLISSNKSSPIMKINVYYSPTQTSRTKVPEKQ